MSATPRTGGRRLRRGYRQPGVRSGLLARAVDMPVICASAAAALFIWLFAPYFAAGDPPGVDAPTFLHFAWVFRQGLVQPDQPVFRDEWWYGGISYLRAYSPLGYGLSGLLSAVFPVGIETSFKLVMAGSAAGVMFATYRLGLKVGLGRPFAFAGALLTLLSVPFLSGISIYGWLPTMVSLPIAISAVIALENWLRTGSTRSAVLVGALLGLALLAHHMTAIAFGLACLVRLAMHFATSANRTRPALKQVGLMVLAAFIASAWWAVPFTLGALSVGFERELPGNWRFGLDTYFASALDRGLTGVETYPSYFGIAQLALAIAGGTYAAVYRTRLLGLTVMAAVFLWFSMGAAGNPLVRVYPLSGLDVSRFAFFLSPMLGILAAYALQVVVKALRRDPRQTAAATAAAIAIALIFPVWDAAQIRPTLNPVEEPPFVTEAIEWADVNIPYGTKTLAIGFRNWDGYWLPARAGLPIMDGWYDEGAPNWRTVREYRLMGWLGQVDPDRLHEVMAAEGVEHVLVVDWQPNDSPHLFEEALRERPDLFEVEADLTGGVVFRRVG